MIRIDEEIRTRKLKARMTLQVHDELVFELPENELDELRKLVKEEMESAPAQMQSTQELRVPLSVELGIGPNWRDLN
jgi:DNA polymerase-1